MVRNKDSVQGETTLKSWRDQAFQLCKKAIDQRSLHYFSSSWEATGRQQQCFENIIEAILEKLQPGKTWRTLGFFSSKVCSHLEIL